MVKRKLKSLLPTLREKKRYVVFEAMSRKPINYNDAESLILQCTQHFMGCFGRANAGVILLQNKWDDKTQRGILKVGHKYVDFVRASFMFPAKLASSEIIFRSLGVSGILRKAENNFLNKK